MIDDHYPVDAVIVGGGFYGSAIAIYLKKHRRFKNVVLIEQEKSLLARASMSNQARVHNGYHYPRSITTAFRSRVNFPRFINKWPEAIDADFDKLYAISRQNSKVSARQFIRFCNYIGASWALAGKSEKSLFNSKLVEEVFAVKEFAFNFEKLREWSEQELSNCGVEVSLSSRVISFNMPESSKNVDVTIREGKGHEYTVKSKYLFNCTYAGLNHLKHGEGLSIDGLKHEIAEMALVELPEVLSSYGITVMDGPFFSVMPFPSRGLHTLSHVRYTPHTSWVDDASINPYERLADHNRASNCNKMLRDAARFLPAIVNAKHVESMFELKTVLTLNESNDGRPILFERSREYPRIYSVLGGKIDNIYDVLERFEKEALTL